MNLASHNIVNFPKKQCEGERTKARNESAYFMMDGGDSMDDLLEKYIEKVDRDQSDLRNDIREMERRYQKNIDDAERRMDKRLDRIEQMIQDQNNKIDSLSEKVTTKLEEDRKYRHTNNIAIVIGVVTTVIAMLGICYATVSTITDILGMVP